MTFNSLFVWATALLALTLAGHVLYQVKFHPLARYPGPFLAKLTNGYGAYHAWKQDVHIEMWRCHEKYGDFVRWGPDRVLVNTVAGMRDIYSAGKNVVKSRGYDALVHGVPSVIAIRDKKEASTRRRLVGEGLSDAALRSHEPVMLTHLDRLDKALAPADGSWSEPRNMADWCSYLAFDIMADVCFSQEYNLISTPTHRYIIAAISGSNIRTTILAYLPWLMWRRLDKKLLRASITARNAFLSFMTALLRARYQASPSPEHADIFSVLVAASPAPKSDADKLLHSYRVRADSATLAIAATDTVATALASTFFYLTHNPRSHRLATAEVRAAFPSLAAIRSGATLTGCTYLRACIDESMRMTAPAGGALFREVSVGGAVIDGRFFPAGVDVGTGIYSVHRNGAAFARPHAFEPERWLRGDAGGREAFGPFSFGPRACVGRGMAVVEILLCMARMLWEFEWEEAEGVLKGVGAGDPVRGVVGRRDVDEYQVFHGGITSVKNGPVLRFCRRQVGMAE